MKGRKKKEREEEKRCLLILMQITNGTPEQCTAETDEIPSTEIG
jgi:hypothetical protein